MQEQEFAFLPMRGKTMATLVAESAAASMGEGAASKLGLGTQILVLSRNLLEILSRNPMVGHLLALIIACPE